MILCVCNGLSERAIRTAIEGRPAPTVGELYRCLGCRVRCGKCIPFVAELAREVRPVRLVAAGPPATEPGEDARGCIPAEAA